MKYSFMFLFFIGFSYLSVTYGDCDVKYTDICSNKVVDNLMKELCKETIDLTTYEKREIFRSCCGRSCRGVFLHNYCSENTCLNVMAIDYSN